MNTYLSKTEREMFLQLNLLLGKAQDVIMAYEGTPNPDKEFMKNLKTGRTFLEKALVKRYMCLEKEDLKRFRNTVKNYKITLLPSDIEKANRKKIQAEMETIVMSADDFKDWYCDAIPYICGKCPHHESPARQHKCRMRKFMEKYDIFPVNTHAEGDVCQYDYLGAGIDLDELERQVKDGETDLKTIQRDIADTIERAV